MLSLVLVVTEKTLGMSFLVKPMPCWGMSSLFDIRGLMKELCHLVHKCRFCYSLSCLLVKMRCTHVFFFLHLASWVACSHVACFLDGGTDLRPVCDLPSRVCGGSGGLPPGVVCQGHPCVPRGEEHPGAEGGAEAAGTRGHG